MVSRVDQHWIYDHGAAHVCLCAAEYVTAASTPAIGLSPQLLSRRLRRQRLRLLLLRLLRLLRLLLLRDCCSVLGGTEAI